MSESLKQRRTFSRFLVPLVLVLSMFTALGAWAFSSPVGASPDDDFHLASIWCGLGDRAGLCEASPRPGYKIIQSELNKASCFAMDASISAGCQDQLGIFTNTQLIESSRGSFSANYPPVYYAFMSLFASQDIQTSVLVMRFLNIAFLVASVLALVWLLPRRNTSTIFWMWAITSVPLGISILTSNNPSSWAIIGVGTSWLALYGFVSSSGWRRAVLGIVFFVEILIASGSRADAALYTILGSVAAIFLSWKTVRKKLSMLWLPAVAAVMSIAFYLGAQQSTIASTGLTDSETGIQSTRGAVEVFGFNLVQMPTLWVGIFGTWGLGWLDTIMPGIVWVTASAVFVTLITLVWSRFSNKQLVTLLGFSFVLYALPMYVLQRGLNHVGEQVQPRYILPLVVVIAGIALLDISKVQETLHRLQPWIYVAGLSIANAVALYINTKRYVSGLENGTGFTLTTNIDWWWQIPVSPVAMWALGAFSFALMLSLGYLLSSRRSTHELA